MGHETALGCVIGRFPHRESEISNSFRSSQLFRSLCEDYYDCVLRLARWSKDTSDVATVNQQDYRELLSDLEADIIRYLGQRSVKPQ